MNRDTIVRGGLWLAARLPLFVLRLLGALVGLWWGYVPGRRMRVALINLRVCFPGREELWYQSMARKSLIEEARNYLEMPHLWEASPGRISRYAVRVRGLEGMERAHAQGRPVILITPHLGSWEFCSLFLSLETPMFCLYRPIKDPTLDAYVRRGRQHTGATLVPADRGGIRQILEALRSGSMVGILPDHVPKSRDDGLMAPFFGEPAMTSVLVSRLAGRLDAVVFVVLSIRCRGGFDVRMMDVHPGVYAADREQSAAGINATVERSIDEAPEQYWWSYPRFRKRRTHPETLY